MIKRSKNINQDAFRKPWRSCRIAPVALAVSVVFILAACEKADETVFLYQNAQECMHDNPSNGEQCTAAYKHAVNESVRTAPKYATREDCIAEFGAANCTSVPAQSETSAPVSSSEEERVAAVQPVQQQSGSMWMPLMAGYMMGNLLRGGVSQPLFTPNMPGSPANGQFTDAKGKTYGAATTGRSITVPKTDMAPKPSVTKTITRGGFGESVAKQSAMQRQKNMAKNARSSRTMGG